MCQAMAIVTVLLAHERQNQQTQSMSLLDTRANLAGRVAVILGGCGEIQGRAITLALADAGVSIAACDIDPHAVRSIVPEVEARGVGILSAHADVTDAAALARFYAEVSDRFDRLDIVVNLPGGVQRSLFVDTTPEQNARDIQLNYGYVIDSVRHAIPLIRRGGRGGSIINFTTIEAFRGAATFAVYAGAKAATTNFSRALAVELGADRIRVNMIAPDTSLPRSPMPPCILRTCNASQNWDRVRWRR